MDPTQSQISPEERRHNRKTNHEDVDLFSRCFAQRCPEIVRSCITYIIVSYNVEMKSRVSLP